MAKEDPDDGCTERNNKRARQHRRPIVFRGSLRFVMVNAAS